MKKTIAVLLVICLCVCLAACGKSEEAQMADELILAIGEVTADSVEAISAAQTYYDSLTDEQKAEVENYAILENAQKILPGIVLAAKQQEVEDLIEQGSYIEASIKLSAIPEIEDYTELMHQCGKGVMIEYVTKNGELKETGNHHLYFKESTDSAQLSVLYIKDTNTIQLQYYGVSYGITNIVLLNIIPGADRFEFQRSTVQFGYPLNYQEGYINPSQYTGTYSGSIADNSSEQLVIHGLTETEVQSIYSEQTRGFKIATMSTINDLLDAIYTEIVEAGFTGTMADLGFTAFEAE